MTNHIFKTVNFLFPLILLLLASPIMLAADNEPEAEEWFQIEFILFEHLLENRDVLRYEDVRYRAPEEKQYAYLYQRGKPLSPYHIPLMEDLSEADLAQARDYLKNSRDFRVLEYGAWKQALHRGETQPPIRIQIGEPVLNRYPFEGELEILRKRFVHARIDLTQADFMRLPYADIKDWFFADETRRWPTTWILQPLAYEHPALSRVGEAPVAMNVHQIRQSRRIRDGEIHYIDHPEIGLIVTAKQIEAPYRFGALPASTDTDNNTGPQ